MIHKTAIIDPKAKIASNVNIGAFSFIGPNVEIGENEKIINPLTSLQMPMIGNVLLFICTTITVVSGASYVKKNLNLIRTD